MITSRDNFSIIKLNFETQTRQDVTIDMQRELRRHTFTKPLWLSMIILQFTCTPTYHRTCHIATGEKVLNLQRCVLNKGHVTVGWAYMPCSVGKTHMLHWSFRNIM